MIEKQIKNYLKEMFSHEEYEDLKFFCMVQTGIFPPADEWSCDYIYTVCLRNKFRWMSYTEAMTIINRHPIAA
jgi:hypothetical protein